MTWKVDMREKEKELFILYTVHLPHPTSEQDRISPYNINTLDQADK